MNTSHGRPQTRWEFSAAPLKPPFPKHRCTESIFIADPEQPAVHTHCCTETTSMGTGLNCNSHTADYLTSCFTESVLGCSFNLVWDFLFFFFFSAGETSFQGKENKHNHSSAPRPASPARTQQSSPGYRCVVSLLHSTPVHAADTQQSISMSSFSVLKRCLTSARRIRPPALPDALLL